MFILSADTLADRSPTSYVKVFEYVFCSPVTGLVTVTLAFTSLTPVDVVGTVYLATPSVTGTGLPLTVTLSCVLELDEADVLRKKSASKEIGRASCRDRV